MTLEPKVGMPVVYHASPDAGPLVSDSRLNHPALIAAVYPGDVVDLVVFPFTYQSSILARSVRKGPRNSATVCWHYPEEG